MAKVANTPSTHIDLCLFGIVDNQFMVLLGLDDAGDGSAQWGLPSGSINTALDNDLSSAVRRVAKERLNLYVEKPSVTGLVGGRNRDPREPWSLSLCYRGGIRADQLEGAGTQQLQELKWMPVVELEKRAKKSETGAIVAKAASNLRAEIESLDIPYEMLNPAFTFNELHDLCQIVLNRKLEQSRLRQQLAAGDQLEELPDEKRRGKGRPASYFRKKPKPHAHAPA